METTNSNRITVKDDEGLTAIRQPSYYDIDFTKVTSFNELILILSTLKTGVTMYPEEYEKSPIKIFLRKPHDSTIKKSNSRVD